jgi:hypothetical protein
MRNDDGNEMLRSTGKSGQKFRLAVSGNKSDRWINDKNWQEVA